MVLNPSRARPGGGGGGGRGAPRIATAKAKAKTRLKAAKSDLKSAKARRESFKSIRSDSENRPKARASKNNKRINSAPNDRSAEVAATKTTRAKRSANPEAYRKMETSDKRNEYPSGSTRSARKVVNANKAVRSAQSRVSGVKARGSQGRRTFFLDGDS